MVKISMGENREFSENDYVINKKGGSSLVEKSPVFSKDGEFLLVISKNEIRVHNIKTSDLVRCLQVDNGKNIVSMEFERSVDDLLYVCFEDGKIYKWDWINGICLSEQKLQLDDFKHVLSFNILDNKQALVMAKAGFNKIVQVAIFNYTNGIAVRFFNSNELECGDKVFSVVIGHRNENEMFAAVCNGTPFLYTFNLSKSHIFQRHKNYNNKAILSVAAHPVNSCVVIGDELGRAIVLYGDFDGKHKLQFEVLHWHQLPLTALAFSQQGTYLLTGGKEQVVVKWTPGDQYNRTFMPRLPGRINHITTDNVHVAIATSNNSIQITNAQLFLKATILESGGLMEMAGVPGTGLLYHAPSSCLILGSHTGHLAMFSTLTNRLLYNVDITMMNQIPTERENLEPADMQIACCAVSTNGRWLITSEFRDDKVNATEERLKFWSGDSAQENMHTTSPFILNTCVNLAHRGARINEIALSKNGDICVTAGSDDRFRLWTTHESVVSGVRRISWKCLAVCYYSECTDRIINESFADQYLTKIPINKEINGYDFEEYIDIVQNDIKQTKMKLGKVALSEDGSLVAAWWGPKLGLWDTGSCDIRAFLAHPALKPVGVDVKFGCNDSAHYVVCTTEECLAVWHLLSLSLTWIVKMYPVSLTADHFSNKMAVITKNNDVFVFKPQQSEYLLCMKRAIDPSLGVLSSCVFTETSKDNIRLYLLRNQQEIFCLEPKGRSVTHNLEFVSSSGVPLSNFSSLLAEKRLNDVKATARSDKSMANWGLAGKKAVQALLASSTHTLPPMSLLRTSFLEALVGAKQRQSRAESEDEDSGEDADAASDSEMTRNESIDRDETVAAKKRSNLTDDQALERILYESMEWTNMLTL